jgi:hypothetical protein
MKSSDFWSERLFVKACCEAGFISVDVLEWQAWRILLDAIAAVMADPRNWKTVRIRRTPRIEAQAARVVRALKRSQPGVLERI